MKFLLDEQTLLKLNLVIILLSRLHALEIALQNATVGLSSLSWVHLYLIFDFKIIFQILYAGSGGVISLLLVLSGDYLVLENRRVDDLS